MKRLFFRNLVFLFVLLAPAVFSTPAEICAQGQNETQEEVSRGAQEEALGGNREASTTKFRHGFQFGQILGFSLNPLGFLLSSSLSCSLPLVEKPGILWEPTNITFGIENALTPAFDEFGGFVAVEPIAFFDVKLACSLRAFYSLFGYGFYPLGSYDADYEPRQKGKDLNRLGYRVSAAPTLKFVFGRMFAVDSLSCNWIDMASLGPSIPEGFYVEPVSNAVMKLQDFNLTNNVYLMYKTGELIFKRTDRELLVGINHYFFTVPRSGYTSSRISLTGLLTAPLGKKTDLTAIVLVGLFLKDRYYSIEEGKIYTAIQAAVKVRL